MLSSARQSESANRFREFNLSVHESGIGSSQPHTRSNWTLQTFLYLQACSLPFCLHPQLRSLTCNSAVYYICLCLYLQHQAFAPTHAFISLSYLEIGTALAPWPVHCSTRSSTSLWSPLIPQQPVKLRRSTKYQNLIWTSCFLYLSSTCRKTL